MKSLRMFAITPLALAAAAALILAQAPAPRTGPGVQAGNDAKEPEVLKTCKVPPPARAAAGQGRGPAAAAPPRDTTVKEIPGVIAAGQQWKKVWETDGNNADGIIATKDGGILIAQNDNSAVVKLDKDGKVSNVYADTNTGGALSMGPKGKLYLNSRGLNAAVLELAPKRRTFANKINGDSLDCVGTVLNDLIADNKGGIYFTMGGLFYADAKGVVTRYGDNLRTNGIMLSPDEKTLYVTNGPTVAAFDVQKDGSLTNQHEFAKLEAGGGGDGSAVDSTGRLYVTSGPGVQVFSPEGKYLGLIPTGGNIISVAFSGPDKKTLYGVISIRDGAKMSAQIITIPALAEGYKGRAK